MLGLPHRSLAGKKIQRETLEIQSRTTKLVCHVKGFLIVRAANIFFLFYSQHLIQNLQSACCLGGKKKTETRRAEGKKVSY